MKKILKFKFLAVAFFIIMLGFSPTKLSGQGFPPQGPFYLNAINCSVYSSFPGCNQWVLQCFETGVMACDVSEQVPCAEVCTPE